MLDGQVKGLAPLKVAEAPATRARIVTDFMMAVLVCLLSCFECFLQELKTQR